MKRLLSCLTALLLMCASGFAGTIPISGTIRAANGNLFNGQIRFLLSYSVARDTSNNNVIVAQSVQFPVANGTLPAGARITPNDVLVPQNTFYTTQYLNSFGTVVAQNVFYIEGQSFNIGSATPTPLTTSNISFDVSRFLILPNVNCASYPGANAGQKIAACIAALPLTGGVANATGFSGPQTITADPFIGVTKPVTLLLGAPTFISSANITVPPNVAIDFGQGAIIGMNASRTLTLSNFTATPSLHFAGAGSTVIGAGARIDVLPQWWGAAGDGVKLTNCSITSGSTVASCPGAAFVPADVGKIFDLQGAGASGINLTGAIGVVGDATTIDLGVVAASSVAGKILLYGTDDAPAIGRALNAGAGKVVRFPIGKYTVGSGFTLGSQHAHTVLRGEGSDASTIYAIGPKKNGTALFDIFRLIAGADYLSFDHIGLSGTNWLGDWTPLLYALAADGVNATPGNGHFLTSTASRYDSFWNIGLHGQGGQHDWQITGSQANYNGWDGFNPNVDRLVFTGNTGNYNGTGGIEAAGEHGMTIVGNTFTGNQIGGVGVGGQTSSGVFSSGVVVAGNTIYGARNGIILAENIQGALITGNTVYKADQYGIVIFQNGASTTPNQNNIIRGNTIIATGCTVAASCTTGHPPELPPNSVTAGMFVSTNGNTIEDNTIVWDTATPNFQQWMGIYTLNSSGNRIRRNRVSVDTRGGNHASYYWQDVTATAFQSDDPLETQGYSGTNVFVNPPTLFSGVTPAVSTGGSVNLSPVLLQGNVLPYTPTGNASLYVTGSPARTQEFTLVITTAGTTSFTITFQTPYFTSAGTLATGTVSGVTFVVRFNCTADHCVEISRTSAM